MTNIQEELLDAQEIIATLKKENSELKATITKLEEENRNIKAYQSYTPIMVTPRNQED